MFSERVKHIGASATLKISAQAKAMRAQGIDVINLSVGEPDFPTPDNIKAAAHRAIDADQTRYTASSGTPELRQVICDWLKAQQGLDYTPGQIIVSNGAKHSIMNVIQTLVDRGDEVIVPAPYWVSYPEMVKVGEGVVVEVNMPQEQGFRLSPESLAQAITPRTKLLFLTNPSNPTGAAYTKEQLQALAKVVVEKDIFVIADEIYSNLVYDGFEFTSFASLGEEVKRRTIVINGVSKAYCMTGWRVGFAAGPEEIIGAMGRLQSHATSNACSISQVAAQEAFSGPQAEVVAMVEEFGKRRKYVLGRLQELAGVTCPEPEGAFYVFPNVSALYPLKYQGKPLGDSFGLAMFLLEEARVAGVPGAPFGAPDNFRFSYANSLENLEKAFDRIAEAIGKLEK